MIEPRNPFEADEGPCCICRKSVDDCICPECPDCGTQGDKKCYLEHRVKLTKAQVIAWQEGEVALVRERANDAIAGALEVLELLRDEPSDKIDHTDFNRLIRSK